MRRRMLAVVALLATLVTACAAPVGKDLRPSDPGDRGLVLGIVGNARGYGPGELPKYQELGVAMAREEWSLGDVDGTILGPAAARGISILPLLHPPGGQRNPDWEAVRAWMADFVRANVAGGTFWQGRPDAGYAPRYVEVLNEPYLGAFSGGRPDPGTYADFVQFVVPAMRAANPNVKILLSADTTSVTNDDDWIAGMYARAPDLNDYFDAVAVHPYGNDPIAECDRNERWNFCRIEEIRERFDQHDAADKRFWITELGNPTDGGRSARTESEQARFLANYIDIARDLGYVDALFVYHYRNLGCTDSRECYFGLTREDGSRKPAWYVLHEAATAAR